MFIFSRDFNQSIKEKKRALRKLRNKEIHLICALWNLGENRTGLTEKGEGILGKIAEIQSYENKIKFGELLDSSEIYKLNNMFFLTKVLSEISMRLWGDK